MQSKLMTRCIDINSSFCPCLLAETNHCVQCSQLQGKEVCDCNWAGVCILYEKLWQPKQEGLSGGTVQHRYEIGAAVRLMEWINDEAALLRLSMPQELVEGLKRPGSFVFLRRPEDPAYVHFPVGVMRTGDGWIDLLIEKRGPKSARLLTEPLGDISVRGPYYNGFFGQPWLDSLSYGKILLVAGGLGQAPALPAARHMALAGNKITAVLAPGRLGRNIIADDLNKLGIQVTTVSSLRLEGFDRVKRELLDPGLRPDLIISAGPDEMHYGVILAMDEAGVNVPMAATNNVTMCCGEGLCGSCIKETKDGRRIRACKVQTAFVELKPGY